MTAKTITRDEDSLQALELRIEELLQLVDQLRTENQQLRQQRAQWTQERVRLLEKFRLARAKVDNVLVRIKGAEQISE